MKPSKDAFMARVEFSPTGCWLWTGPYSNGYGKAWIDGNRRPVWAHRVAYEFFVGSIPPGLHLDHTCRTRPCINPDHLEPVTIAENVRRQYAANPHPNSRKTHCPQGHPYSAENTRIKSLPNGSSGRICRTCHRDSERQRKVRG